TSHQSSHRNHGHNNDRHGSDRRSGGDNHGSNNNYSGNNNRNSGYGRDQRNRGQQSNRSANSEVPLRATLTQFALLVDVDTQESVVELLVLASSVAKLAICRRIARRTPPRVHLIISALQAHTLLSHGCEGFLATIQDTTSDVSSIHDQPIVSEFPDVFPDELPGMPPVREVEFNIELIPGSEPISKAPY
nr:putative reverse transcriptase domain, aspartic peptidase domain protein [Tanacetum cinerariifolium]